MSILSLVLGYAKCFQSDARDEIRIAKPILKMRLVKYRNGTYDFREL